MFNLSVVKAPSSGVGVCDQCNEECCEEGRVECPIVGEPAIEVGVPDSITYLDFEDLTPGGDIPLSSNGQTFLAVQVAVRAQNIEEEADINLRVQLTGTETTATSTVRERLRCRNDGSRYIIPVVLSSEDLGPDREVQDRAVDIEVEIVDVEGNRGVGTASGTLRRM